MNVKLTIKEYVFAAFAGFSRHTENLEAGRIDSRNREGDGYDAHVHGAVCEFVVAKALGIFWPGPGVLWSADVGGGIQVRSTKREWGSLIVHKEDADKAPFVLVTGCLLNYDVRGWLYGHECKQQGWWSAGDGRPAFFVPQTALKPIEELRPKELARA